MTKRRSTKTKRVKAKAKRPTRRAKTPLKANKSKGLRLLKAPKPKAGPSDTSYLSWIEITDSPEWAIAS